MYDQFHEINEAIAAGQLALSSLQEADAALSSASNWGLLDIFGGNFVSGMFKHSRIDDARWHLREAQRNLEAFRRECEDVPGMGPEDIGIGSFLTFADFFFDGLIADFVVQSRIGDARREVRLAQDGVLAGLRRLEERRAML